MILQDMIIRGQCAEGEDGSLFEVMFLGDYQEDFFSDHIVELSVKVVKVEGGVAVFLSEYFGDGDGFELVSEEGPFVAESDHGFDTFLMLLLERYGGGGLQGGVQCQCTVRTDRRLRFLLWE